MLRNGYKEYWAKMIFDNMAYLKAARTSFAL